MQEYVERKHSEMTKFIQDCERRCGMSSSEFLSYYRDLESHGSEEEYEWYVYLSFLGQR